MLMLSTNYNEKRKKYFYYTIILIFFLSISSVKGFAQNCNTALPTIRFASNKTNLTQDAQKILAAIAETLKNNPGCTITISAGLNSTKSGQAICQKRGETTKAFFVEKLSINPDRMNINCTYDITNVNIVEFSWYY